MKNAFKVMLIVSGIFSVLGLSLVIAGFALGASWSQVAEAVTSGKYGIYFPISDSIGEKDSISSGTYDLKEIKNLVIDVGAGEIGIENGEKDQMDIKNDNMKGKLSVTVNGDIMKIKCRGRQFRSGGEAVIMIPSDIIFDSIELEMSAGTLNVQKLNAKKLDVNVNAGELDCNDRLTAENSDWQINAGKINVDWLDSKSVTLSCNAGKMDITLAGKAEDYRMDGKCTAGKVDFDGHGFNWDDHLEYGSRDAKRNINVDCTAGKLDIGFIN